MAKFTSLSSELVAMVAEKLLESEDLFNLRRTCRYIEGCSKHYYLRRYFYERRHMLSRHSLKTLTEIISDDVFGPALHTLVIGTDHLTDDPPLEDPLPFRFSIETTPIPRELNIINKSIYDRHLAEQKNLLSSGLAAAYLTSILAKSINCNALIIDDDYRAWGAGFLKCETGVYPTTNLKRTDSQEFIEKALEAVLAAVTSSGIYLQSLQIYVGCITMPISPEILALPRLQPLDFPCSTTLTQLLLAVESGYEYLLNRDSWPKTLSDFILQFSCLETLELAFEPRVESEYFHKISQLLYLPCLRHLKLSTIDCTEDDLFHLFQTHHETLEQISLDTVNLIYEGDSWHSLLIKIGDQLQLTGLVITNCFQDDEDVNIQEDDAAPPFLEAEVSVFKV